MVRSHRRLADGAIPSYGTFITVAGLALVFYLMLRILKNFSDRWKRMMKKRIEHAINLRKAAKDSFRADNGYSWDFVMVFEVYGPEKKLNVHQQKPTNSLKHIVSLLNDAGLQTKLFYSVQNDEVYCKIRAKLDRLMKEADRINYRLQLDPIQLANALSMGHLTGPLEKQWKPLRLPASHIETDIEPYEYIFTDFNTENVEQALMFKKYENGTIFRGVDRMRLISGILAARKMNGGCHLDVYQLIQTGCMIAFFPLHDYVELRALEEKWIRFFQFPWRQNVDLVKDYFGEKIGMYFLWLGHYTTWLMGASVVGFCAWIFVASENNNPDSPVMPYFATFIALWATLFMEYWKRKEKTAAMKWGTVGFEDTEQERPQFEGEIRPSPVDGSDQLFFPTSKYSSRLAKSAVVVGGMICLVLAVVASIFYFKIVMTLSGALVVDNVQMAGTVASLLNAVQIQVMNVVYGSLAVRLNEYENHRTETIYEDALIGKTFVFQFVNSFASLFYISFVKPYIQDFDPCTASCMTELQTALGTIFLTRLATGNVLKVNEIGRFVTSVMVLVMQILLPWLDARARRKAETKGIKASDGKKLSEVEKLFMLAPFTGLDLFADFSSMVIQFGYTTMFIVAYPLATVLACLNNYVEMRTSAWKLCQLCRRPDPRGCEDIGTWAAILELMGGSAVLINAGLVAFTGSFAVNYTWPGRIWVFIGMATAIYGCKLLAAAYIDDVPREVVIQLQRQEFITSKVIDNVGDDVDDDLPKTFVVPTYTIRINDDDPL